MPLLTEQHSLFFIHRQCWNWYEGPRTRVMDLSKTNCTIMIAFSPLYGTKERVQRIQSHGQIRSVNKCSETPIKRQLLPYRFAPYFSVHHFHHTTAQQTFHNSFSDISAPSAIHPTSSSQPPACATKSPSSTSFVSTTEGRGQRCVKTGSIVSTPGLSSRSSMTSAPTAGVSATAARRGISPVTAAAAAAAGTVTATVTEAVTQDARWRQSSNKKTSWTFGVGD